MISRNFEAPMTSRQLKERIERKQLEYFVNGVEVFELKKQKLQLEIKLLEKKMASNNNDLDL